MEKKIAVVYPEGKSFGNSRIAYIQYLRENDYHVVEYSSLPSDFIDYDFVFLMFGYFPRWSFPRTGNAVVIGDYLSLSLGQLGRAKDFLKKLFNVKCDYLVFQNIKVHESFGVSKKQKVIFRSQGYFKENIQYSDNRKPKYDFVYAGSLGRNGVMENLASIASSGCSMAVVGNTEKEMAYFKARQIQNIEFFGKVDVGKVYEVMKESKIGISFVPDEHPLNIQECTKVIEYLACGLTVYTNRYSWTESFSTETGVEFIYMDEIKPESVNAQKMVMASQHAKVAHLEWKAVLDDCGLKGLLESA